MDAPTTTIAGEVGLIGLGAMGAPIAGRFLAAGHSLTVFDRDAARMAPLVQSGAKAGSDAGDVVARCDVVCTSLTNSAVFLQVAREQLLPASREGQIFVELGTTRAPEIRRLADEFRQRGAWLLDVPVSGGGQGAQRGQLRVFVGGEEHIARRVWGLFEAIGRPDATVYCGPSGMGMAMKGVQQLSSGLRTAALVEAIAFGARAGLSLETIAGGMSGDGELLDVLQRVRTAQREGMDMKFGEWEYYVEEAAAQGFEMPILEALSTRLKDAPPVARDGQQRPFPSYWEELVKTD